MGGAVVAKGLCFKFGHVDIVCFLSIGASQWLYKASIHLVFFPLTFLMLDESTTVVDQYVCVKSLPAKMPTTYHVSSTILFIVSVKIMVLLLLNVLNLTGKVLWACNEPVRV